MENQINHKIPKLLEKKRAGGFIEFTEEIQNITFDTTFGMMTSSELNEVHSEVCETEYNYLI